MGFVIESMRVRPLVVPSLTWNARGRFRDAPPVVLANVYIIILVASALFEIAWAVHLGLEVPEVQIQDRLGALGVLVEAFDTSPKVSQHGIVFQVVRVKRKVKPLLRVLRLAPPQ